MKQREHFGRAGAGELGCYCSVSTVKVRKQEEGNPIQDSGVFFVPAVRCNTKRSVCERNLVLA